MYLCELCHVGLLSEIYIRNNLYVRKSTHTYIPFFSSTKLRTGKLHCQGSLWKEAAELLFFILRKGKFNINAWFKPPFRVAFRHACKVVELSIWCTDQGVGGKSPHKLPTSIYREGKVH